MLLDCRHNSVSVRPTSLSWMAVETYRRHRFGGLCQNRGHKGRGDDSKTHVVGGYVG